MFTHTAESAAHRIPRKAPPLVYTPPPLPCQCSQKAPLPCRSSAGPWLSPRTHAALVMAAMATELDKEFGRLLESHRDVPDAAVMTPIKDPSFAVLTCPLDQVLAASMLGVLSTEPQARATSQYATLGLCLHCAGACVRWMTRCAWATSVAMAYTACFFRQGYIFFPSCVSNRILNPVAPLGSSESSDDPPGNDVIHHNVDTYKP